MLQKMPTYLPTSAVCCCPRGAVLHCAGWPASCCLVLVGPVLFLVLWTVVRCCVLCRFRWLSVVRWCCPVVWCGVLWCPAALCCVLQCSAAMWCCAVGGCRGFSFARCGCGSVFLYKALVFLSTCENMFGKQKMKMILAVRPFSPVFRCAVLSRATWCCMFCVVCVTWWWCAV